MAPASCLHLPVSRKDMLHELEYQTETHRHGYDNREYCHAAMGQLQPGMSALLPPSSMGIRLPEP
jgi:hypothetical protein